MRGKEEKSRAELGARRKRVGQSEGQGGKEYSRTECGTKRKRVGQDEGQGGKEVNRWEDKEVKSSSEREGQAIKQE